MNEFRVSYDRNIRQWVLVDMDSGGTVVADRMILDAPAKFRGNGFVCKGILKADEVSSLADFHATVRTATLERAEPLPGRVNDASMLEWCVVFDEPSGKWVTYRQDMPAVRVTSDEIELDCHAISSEGVLHCRAEMLLNGRTNKVDSHFNAKSVRLRTLTVHDQRVVVQKITMVGSSRNL